MKTPSARESGQSVTTILPGTLALCIKLASTWRQAPCSLRLRQPVFACGEGKRVIIDGPFAETREQLGGFFIIKAENLDEAIDLAGNIPAGKFGTVEIRPLVPVAGLPMVQASSP